MATVAKEHGHKLVASNRKARHDYLIEDTFEAGLVLMGTEVKSLRQGRASLIDGFATVRDGELWLEGRPHPGVHPGHLDQPLGPAPAQAAAAQGRDPQADHKTRESGHTIVPLSLYFKDGRAKVEIALAKGKRNYDKRQTLREQQDRREAERAMSTRRER